MFDRCPGAADMRTPTLKITKCPECGSEVEIFSVDRKMICSDCGFIIYNDIESCIQWCKYSKDCVSDNIYIKLKKSRSMDSD